MAEKRSPDHAARVTYVGHATLIIELGGVRLLTDPNWENTLGRFLPRVRPAGVPIDALPVLDAILLTHAHADHLSFSSLDQLPRDIPLYAPPAVARWLRKRGHAHAEALAPGETARVGEVMIRTAAAAHVGARYGVDRWRGAANMYLIDTNSTSVFFAGDTALMPDSHAMVAEHVHESERRLDLALLPIGHAPWWKRRSFRRGHLTTADALTLFERLDARMLVPYHWGTFRHVTSGAFDAIEQLRARLLTHHRAADVRILEPGESLIVGP